MGNWQRRKGSGSLSPSYLTNMFGNQWRIHISKDGLTMTSSCPSFVPGHSARVTTCASLLSSLIVSKMAKGLQLITKMWHN